MSYNPKILIVDDEPQICDSLNILLSRQGYDITTVQSGKKALEILEDNQFDLLLLDMVIPDLNGFEIMDHINSHWYDLLIIVITGNASIESAVKALKKGAYDYLRKPFEYEELLNRVGNALNQQKLGYEKKIVDGKLARSEERYQYLVQNSPDIIYMLDNKNNFTFVNLVVEELLGFSSSQLKDQHFTKIVYKDDIEKANRFIAANGTYDYPSSVVELKLTSSRKENMFKLFEIKHIAIKSKPLEPVINKNHKNDRNIVGVYGVARDITYKKQLENRVHQAEKMGAIGTLAGGIAHDFNNILMGIMGYNSLLLSKVDSSSPFHGKLKSIEQHVRSGADLTKQLLGFARGGSYDIRPSDITEIVKKTSDMFARTKKEIDILFECEKNIFSVEVDPAQIEQVLLNLYMNAWQAMPEGGKIYTEIKNLELDNEKAETLALKAGKYVETKVRDTGIGMDEETAQRIFEPFFTTKEMGRGTGLGLASAYGIIKNHCGSISVDSEKGKGTTFTIYLPSSEKKAEKKKESSDSILNGSETILLVDDEDDIINVGAEILETLGYKVMTAKNGEEAIKLYKENIDIIDVLVIDMVMPRMSGGELYKRLKALNSEIKVLLASGYSIDGEATKILEQGCNGFIQKPFGIVELSQGIRNILD
jgi:PAS domain S-box-containing protein